MLLCVVGAAARAGLPGEAPFLLRRLFAPGLNCDITTVKGETLRLDGVYLKTPSDFETLAVTDPILTFNASTIPPDFRTIQKITLNGLSTGWLGSRPERMECYRLGNVRNAIPPPPDWQRAYGQIPPWNHAEATRDAAGLPFLNHTIFCWDGAPRPTGKEVGVYLFRQNFEIAHPETVIRATLRLAGNAEPLEAAFNECPLHLGSKKVFAIGEYEVTPLVREGSNIFAIKIQERPGMPEANYGLAFHLELVRREPGAAAPQIDPSAALVTSAEGDRIWGWVGDLRGDRLLLDTGYGPYTLNWEDCTGLLFPGGWLPNKPHRKWPERLDAEETDESLFRRKMAALPFATMPHTLQDCLLLSEGRLTTAKPSYVVNESLFFEGVEGKQYSLPMAEVFGIFPPRPPMPSFKRPDRQTAVLLCQLLTTGGEIINGLLREMNSERTVIESTQILAIKTSWVASIQFPYHAATLGPEIKNKTVGLVPLAEAQEEYRDAYNTDSRHIQGAVFAIGAESRNLSLETLADRQQLRPEAIPVLVSFDPVGAYLHTLRQAGDAQAALVEYLEKGGIAIALSRGGAFRSPVKNDNGQLTIAAANPDLASQLAFKTIHPGDSSTLGAVPFDHPPNTVEQIYFQRSSSLPKGLVGLPRRIEMGPMISAPFYPMMPRGGDRGMIVYELFDGTGASYGPVLTILPQGRGYVVLIDHLLWQSRSDDRPFSECVLPILLRWALSTAGR